MAPAPPSVSAPPVASAPASRPAPVQNAPARDAPGKSANDGDNPRAKQQEADYFAQLSAHLNKRKRYPTEAKKARQQGVVTVRFTVHADGSVTGSAIRRSSGHELLDQATLELLQRVAPLPRFPKSMTKPSITLSLPIDYSLQTS
nr:energy transducer TonB [Tsuneonella aeria]